MKRYHQCKETCPFLLSSLKDIFGKYGETTEAQMVMDGSFVCLGSTNELMQLLLSQCKVSHHQTTMAWDPTVFNTSWMHMKEKTGTHYLHFGYFLAACKHKPNLLVHYMVPFHTGHSPHSCWQKASNVIILKKARVFDIEKLKTVHLFQLDFNHKTMSFWDHN